jgi:hypothetical protein
MLAGSKFSKIRCLVAKIWAMHWTVPINFLLIFLVITWLCLLSMGPNPLEYIGTITWQEKKYRGKKFSYPGIFCPKGG